MENELNKLYHILNRTLQTIGADSPHFNDLRKAKILVNRITSLHRNNEEALQSMEYLCTVYENVLDHLDEMQEPYRQAHPRDDDRFWIPDATKLLKWTIEHALANLGQQV